MNIAVFASHGGSDMQAIVDGCKNNKIEANVVVYDEYNCTILDESTGSHYVSKESYFNLETTNTDTIFRYALKKMRERNLYVTDYIDEKNVIYGEYEPEGV